MGVNIGSNIKKLRLSKKLTQQNMADLLGMTQSAYRKFEIDFTILQTDTLEKIAGALGVTMVDLVTDNKKTDENIRLHELRKYFDKLSDNAQDKAVNIMKNIYEIDK